MAPRPLANQGTPGGDGGGEGMTKAEEVAAAESQAFLTASGKKINFEENVTSNGKSHPEPIHPRKETEDFVPPDGGWGWVVCVASFWTNGSVFGIINCFGIMYVSLLEEFENDSDGDIAFKTSWIGSLQITTTFFMSPFASMLVDRLGIRVTSFIGSAIATIGMLASSFVYQLEIMYLTYGCMVGLGFSLIYTPSMVILGHYFKKHLGLVNGIVAFGSAVFTFCLPYALKVLLANIGMRHTMQCLAGILSLLMVCSVIWKPMFQARHSELDKYLTSTESLAQRCSGFCAWMSKFCNVSIWKNKGYRIWVTALPVSFIGYFIPFVHLVKHTMTTIPDAQPEVLIMCLGATSGISRLIFGKVADLPKVNRIRMQQVSFLLMGIATTCIPFAKHFFAMIAIVLIMGICDGCMVCLMGPIAFDLLGPSGAAQGLGCLLGLMSLPMTAGPPLAGLVYDHMKTYDIAFWVAGAPPIIGGLILFLVPRSTKQHTIAVTEIETIATMSMENLDKAGTEESRYRLDSNGAAHIILVRNRINKQQGEPITNSVPNLTTCSETGKLVLSHSKSTDPDNLSLA